MELRFPADLPLSQLTLGTVQMGLDYGIANRTGRPEFRQACEIVAAAYEGGVRCLDTAASYGVSEEVLGAVLADLTLADKMTVVTKVQPITGDIDGAEAAAMVEASVTRSLQRLGLERLPVCLMHWEDNFAYIDALLALRDRGLVGHVGCSVMTPRATQRILDSGLADALQIPTNLLDKRFTGPGLIQRAAKEGVAVFVRSIYLQGLVFLPEAAVPAELAAVIPVRRELQSIAGDADMAMSELCMRYALDLPGVASLVVGVETVEQMRQNLDVCRRGPLPPDLMERIRQAVPDLPEVVVMPTLWPPDR